MANWLLNTDVVQVLPWMLDRPVCCEWIHKCRGGMDAKERPWCGRSSRK